jgi:hypothetical protein
MPHRFRAQTRSGAFFRFEPYPNLPLPSKARQRLDKRKSEVLRSGQIQPPR